VEAPLEGNELDLASVTDRALEAYYAGTPEPLYQAFLNQARASTWKNLGYSDPTLCRQIAERGLLGMKTFKGESRVSTWFYRIAENECKRELRRIIGDRNLHVFLDHLKPGSNEARQVNAHQTAISDQNARESEAETLRAGALAHLPDEQASVLELREQGFTLKEIAEKIGIPLQTAASRYRLAFEKIRKYADGIDKKGS
jgi:RNA polymerase sigma-70 factor, ECF subfamily